MNFHVEKHGFLNNIPYSLSLFHLVGFISQEIQGIQKRFSTEFSQQPFFFILSMAIIQRMKSSVFI